MAQYSKTSLGPNTRRFNLSSRRPFPVPTGWNVPQTKRSKTQSVKACAFLLGYLAAYLAAGYGAIAVVERIWFALVP
ncbi:MAG TPA: hypothetical protein VNK23_04945 [Candidatus Dormibacteraeota bacterium]|nr:hypothetical protein [Candidatus Dormibacteraeota bacterium]